LRRITEEDLTLVDAAGDRYPPRLLGPKLLDTLLKTLLLVAILVVIGVCWGAFA
jgi:hypothetical protein